MAKGKGFGGFPGMGGGGNMNQLLAQAQKMQKDMEKAQEEVAALTADATAGGGAVKAVVNGSHEVVSLSIDPVWSIPKMSRCSRIWWSRRSTRRCGPSRRSPQSACRG